MALYSVLDDRLIDNISPCEKLCFMLLDKQKHMEDKLDAIIMEQEHTERWMIYHTFVSRPKQCLVATVLDKLPEQRRKSIITECVRPFGLARRWDTIYNVSYRRINLTRLRELIGDCKKYEKIINTLPRRVWSRMTMEEVRQYIP